MSPEPNQHPIIARAGHQRILEGEDILTVLLWCCDEAVRDERERRGDLTPTVTARERLLQSQRPTAPPRPPAPVGALGPGTRTPTQRGMPVRKKP